MFNILYMFVLPPIVGIAFRVLLNRMQKPYLVTAALGIITLIAWCIVLFNPKLFGIPALQVTLAFVGSFFTGVVLNYLGRY